LLSACSKTLEREISFSKLKYWLFIFVPCSRFQRQINNPCLNLYQSLPVNPSKGYFSQSLFCVDKYYISCIIFLYIFDNLTVFLAQGWGRMGRRFAMIPISPQRVGSITVLILTVTITVLSLIIFIPFAKSEQPFNFMTGV